MMGRVATVGANQFFYWVEGDPRACRAPDVYVVEGVSLPPDSVGVWKTWEGHVPSFAFEVVSDDRLKDYEAAPKDYGAAGVRELVVFDPWVTPRSRKRVRWQVFRRDARGELSLVERSSSDRVWSESLGCWLRAVEGSRGLRVRLATGPTGDALIPTASARAKALLRIAESQSEAERRARQEAEAHARRRPRPRTRGCAPRSSGFERPDAHGRRRSHREALGPRDARRARRRGHALRSAAQAARLGHRGRAPRRDRRARREARRCSASRAAELEARAAASSKRPLAERDAEIAKMRALHDEAAAGDRRAARGGRRGEGVARRA